MSILFLLQKAFLTAFTFIESIVFAKTEKAPVVDSSSLMAQQCSCSHNIVSVGDQIVLLDVKHRHARCPPIRLDVDVADIQSHPIKNKFARVVFDIVTGLVD